MIQATEDHIFVRRSDPITKVGMIELPANASETVHEGVVVAVGPGKIKQNGSRLPLAVKAGDKIAFGFRADTSFKVDGMDILCITENDVIGFVDE